MENMIEDLAAQTIADMGLGTPVDAFRLAHRLGFQTRTGPIECSFLLPARDSIVLPSGARRQRQQSLVAAHCADHLLARDSLPRTTGLVGRFGAALMVPWPALSRDIDDLGLDLEGLRSRHPNASATLLAGRMAELIGGRVAVWKALELVWTRGRGVPDIALRGLVASCRAISSFVGSEKLRVWPIGDDYSVSVEL